ncbi:MAG TPA: DUF917 domain-containing protein [Firmicutes bacterium]|nr:DUF917 domain-containing protein [Bacillota bacterium]
MACYELKHEDLDAFFCGLGILGTGGGGELEWGRVIIENDMAKGRKYQIVDPEDVADDAFVCSGGIMGSVKTLLDMSYEEIVASWEDSFVLVEVFREMERTMGRKLDYVVPFETGGLNTPVIMSLAARLGIPVINGDGVGRAAPETQMSSFIGHGVSLYPMPLVDAHGNTVVVKRAQKTTYADEIGRVVVTKGGGFGGNAHYPMSGKELKTSVVPGCMTKALEVGKAVLVARKAGQDPVKTVAEAVNGKIMFKGEIAEVTGEDKGGFYLTDVKLEGKGDFAKQKADVVVKNEYMAAWVNGQVKAIFPDPIYFVDLQGEGIMTVDLKEGLDVVVIGSPCHPRLREALATKEGKESFSGVRFGFPKLDYVPVEELNR